MHVCLLMGRLCANFPALPAHSLRLHYRAMLFNPEGCAKCNGGPPTCTWVAMYVGVTEAAAPSGECPHFATIRIPIVVVPKGRICAETMYDVFEVIAWSLRHLLSGIWPNARHNGEP